MVKFSGKSYRLRPIRAANKPRPDQAFCEIVGEGRCPVLAETLGIVPGVRVSS